MIGKRHLIEFSQDLITSWPLLSFFVPTSAYQNLDFLRQIVWDLEVHTAVYGLANLGEIEISVRPLSSLHLPHNQAQAVYISSRGNFHRAIQHLGCHPGRGSTRTSQLNYYLRIKQMHFYVYVVEKKTREKFSLER